MRAELDHRHCYQLAVEINTFIHLLHDGTNLVLFHSSFIRLGDRKGIKSVVLPHWTLQ